MPGRSRYDRDRSLTACAAKIVKLRVPRVTGRKTGETCRAARPRNSTEFHFFTGYSGVYSKCLFRRFRSRKHEPAPCEITLREMLSDACFGRARWRSTRIRADCWPHRRRFDRRGRARRNQSCRPMDLAQQLDVAPGDSVDPTCSTTPTLAASLSVRIKAKIASA